MASTLCWSWRRPACVCARGASATWRRSPRSTPTPHLGFVGLAIPRFEASFTPCVEIGWRLAREHWGRGYAPEAARAALGFGFDRLGLAEIVSFTVPANTRSRRVMEKIGMHRDPADDFDHPALEAGHPLRRHVLYRVAWSDPG